jgi:hypothetical protein
MAKIASKGAAVKAMARKGKTTVSRASAKMPRLLAGGNPQVARADGNAPVRAYIAAMPGWKGGVGRRLDSLIVRTAPAVRKAVRWNQPFYRIDGQGWLVGDPPRTRTLNPEIKSLLLYH